MTINYEYANLLRSGSSGLNVFSQDDLEQIHLTTLDVLWNIGLKIKRSHARQILRDCGCVVEDKTEIVKFPSHLVEDAIQSAPATYRAHAIDPENDYVAGGKKTGFVNFGEAPALMGPMTRRVWSATKKDVDDTVRFVDTLDNIIGWERPLTPQDLEEDMRERKTKAVARWEKGPSPSPCERRLDLSLPRRETYRLCSSLGGERDLHH